MISVHNRESVRKFEDSKINLLDIPIRDDMMQTKEGQINLLLKAPNVPPHNRRITGNTTISSSTSLMNKTSDFEPGQF